MAPVYLEEASRIRALPCCLLPCAVRPSRCSERELRRAMDREAIASLPLFPEGRRVSPSARPADWSIAKKPGGISEHFAIVGRISW